MKLFRGFTKRQYQLHISCRKPEDKHISAKSTLINDAFMSSMYFNQKLYEHTISMKYWF